METGALVYNLCDSSGIYHGNDRESVAWMECMDYTGRKWQLFGQICLPFTIIFFRTVRDRHSASPGIFFIGYTGKKNHIFTCFRKSEGGQNWIWYIELNFQKML